jgi:hypothetical protein
LSNVDFRLTIGSDKIENRHSQIDNSMDHCSNHHHEHGSDCDHGYETPGHDFWLDAPPILPMQLPGNESVADLIDNGFAHSGFNGRRLAEGAQLYQRMIDANATVALTVAGAMAHIGLGGAFISLIERFVDFMIARANLYHDLHLAYGFHGPGYAEVDDNAPPRTAWPAFLTSSSARKTP